MADARQTEELLDPLDQTEEVGENEHENMVSFSNSQLLQCIADLKAANKEQEDEL